MGVVVDHVVGDVGVEGVGEGVGSSIDHYSPAAIVHYVVICHGHKLGVLNVHPHHRGTGHVQKAQTIVLNAVGLDDNRRVELSSIGERKATGFVACHRAVCYTLLVTWTCKTRLYQSQTCS